MIPPCSKMKSATSAFKEHPSDSMEATGHRGKALMVSRCQARALSPYLGKSANLSTDAAP